MWDDQSYGNTNYNNWAIAGGDTVIVDNTKQWRVGFDGNGSSTDAWCFGGNGGPYGCTNPTVPAGTSSKHTRILGRNYANCSTGNASNRAAMTQIFGGHAVGEALNLQGAQYVDVECMEVTRHSNCMVHGQPVYPSGCDSTNGQLDDFDSDGIAEDASTHDVVLQDVWVHGHTDRGILGPIGGLVTANRVNVSYNGNAGWDFDTASGSNDLSVNGSIAWHYVTIEWNGCNQEYPAVDTYPAISCYSQSTGGYGDGVGTPAGMGMNIAIDHALVRYNTQDGLDFGHIDTGSSTISITDSYSYGNNGEAFKWGTGFTSQVFENNLAIGNCLRMSQPLAGAPSNYNAHLEDFCRAGSTISFNFGNHQAALFANNTIVGYAPSMFDFNCAGGANCNTSSLTLTNNIIVGYDNPTTYNLGGAPGGPGLYCGPGCNSESSLVGIINRHNNAYFGIRGACEAGVATESMGGAISGETCNDPLFVGEPESFTTEAALDHYDFNLSSGSPAIGSGIAVSGVTTDYNGAGRPVPPSLGAIEYVPALPVPTLSFAPVANKTYGADAFTVSAASASDGAVSYAVTSGPASLSGDVVTITGAGTVVLSAMQAATSTYAAAAASVSFTVAKAVPELSFASVGSLSYGEASFSVSASSASSGAVTYAVVSGPATISGNMVTLTGVGIVILKASQAATGNYVAATVTISMTVAAEVPALSFAPIGNETFGNAPLVVSATSASHGAVSYAVVSGPATVAGNVVTLTGAGTVVLSASQAASGNYAATTAMTHFTVSAEAPALRFAAISNQTFGNGPVVVSATSASKGAVTYAVANGPATISGAAVALTGVGSVVLSASQVANGNYAAATATTSFMVAPGVPVLRFATIGNQSYGSEPFAVVATSASSGAVTYAVVSGPATLSGKMVTLTGLGPVVLSASQAASGNYVAATATIAFTVTAEVPALRFAAIGNQSLGSSPFAVTASSASAGAVTYKVVSGPATISGNKVTLTGAGTVVLGASQAASGDYAAATATVSFSVALEMPALSFAAIKNQTFGNAPVVAKATSASSGAVSYAVVSGPAVIASSGGIAPPGGGGGAAPNAGAVVVLTGAGTVVVSASQAASGNYGVATAKTSFTVAPATPTLSFAAILNKVVGVAPFQVDAGSASNGAVSYTVVSGPASVSGNLVTVIGIGHVTLAATQQATQNYAAATAQTSFTVEPPVAFAGASTTTAGGAVTAASGGDATYHLTLLPGAGSTFEDAIGLSAAGMPPGSTATFSPATIGAGSVATTVALNIQVSSQATRDQRPGQAPSSAPMALGLAFLPLLGMRASRKRRQMAGVLVLFAVLSLGASTGLSGCGSTAPRQGSAGAPQTYTVAVTATDEKTGWTSATNVSLTVQ